MSDASFQYIDTYHGLLEACNILKTSKVLCVDTEFHREKTYYPQFALLQVGSLDATFIIDPLKINDLTPFWRILLNPNTLKVFHAGRQDLEIIIEHAGALPLPIFDTQIAAALLGYGQQVGFGSLVQRITKKVLAKGESFSNWLQRPLTKQQLQYAAADVIFLMPIYQALKEELQARKRSSWLDEEQAILINPDTYTIDKNEVFWRVKGVNKLKPKQLAILRELAIWREEQAQKKDIPRRRLIADEPLLELAKRDKLNMDVLKRMRGLHEGMIRRFGKTWIALWQRGMDCPEDQWPKLASRKNNTSGTELRAELLDTLLRLKADESSISPSILANKSELSTLASWGNKPNNKPPELACLQGWRAELVGNDLLRLLRGEICLRLNPNTGLPMIDDYKGDTPS